MGSAKDKARARIAKIEQASPQNRLWSWWRDFDVSREKLALIRVCFFGILALDAFLQLKHAPRYGAGDFNVTQLSWLPLPAPSRTIMVGVELTLCYLLTLAAFGVATRAVVPIAAALDFYAYFSSQLDSYQHHYLVVLLLGIASFIPWHDPSPRVKSWALRLFTAQLSLLYFWAAVAKMDPLWIDGSALQRQLSPHWLRDMIGSHYGALACLVLLTELALATAWQLPRTWKFVILPGILFHVGVELAGFQIGQFSYVMIAIYTIMLPEELTAYLPKLNLPDLGIPLAAGLTAAAIAIGVVLLSVGHIPELPWIAAITIVGTVGAFAWHRHWRAGAAHLAACVLMCSLALGTDQLLDYYRFWGGAARRLGNEKEARAAYAQVLAIDPDHPNATWALGQMDLEDTDYDGALAHFKRLIDLEPKRARGWDGVAKALIGKGDTAGARDAVTRALQIEPQDPDAQGLRQRLP